MKCLQGNDSRKCLSWCPPTNVSRTKVTTREGWSTEKLIDTEVQNQELTISIDTFEDIADDEINIMNEKIVSYKRLWNNETIKKGKRNAKFITYSKKSKLKK